MEKITLTIPVSLKSEANIIEHWSKKHKKRKNQALAVLIAWQNAKIPALSFPVKVTLTRHSPRFLDYDNLVAAFKWIRDAVADKIKPGFKPGRADGGDDIVFHYVQKKCPVKHITVELDFE